MKTIKNKYLILVMLPLFIINGGFAQVTIEDPNLEYHVRHVLGIDSITTITQNMADSLFTLEANNLGLISIEGVQHFRNLEHLFLSGNYVTDLAPAMLLPNLKLLDASNNIITDISPLVLCASNELTVNIKGNCISDFSLISQNWMTDIELLGAGQQQCEQQQYMIYRFVAEAIEGSPNEIRFIYRAWGLPDTLGWLSFGDGDSTQFIGNAFLDTLTHQYVNANGKTANLRIGGKLAEIELDFLFSTIALSKPDENEVIASVNPNFEWFPNEHSEFYSFKLLSSDDTLVTEFVGIQDTSLLLLSDTLLNFNSYKWKVRGSSMGSNTLWSEIRDFSIMNDTPQIIQGFPQFSFVEDQYPDTLLLNLNNYFSDSIPSGNLSYNFINSDTIPLLSVNDSLLYLHPKTDYFGNSLIEINAVDMGNLHASTILNINITPVNDPPVVLNTNMDTVLVEGFATYKIALSSIFTDPDDVLTGNAYGIVSQTNDAVIATILNDSLFITQMSGMLGEDNVLISASDGEYSTSVYYVISVVEGILPFYLKVYLEGVFENNKMRTSLDEKGVIPLHNPFSGEPWNYTGFDSINELPELEIVDWVLVELRDADTVSSATTSTIIDTKAGFLLSNGRIIDKNGEDKITFYKKINHKPFVVVWPRNHLKVINADTCMEIQGNYIYDFTKSDNSAFGSGATQAEIIPGYFGLFGGDFNADGVINDLDKTQVWMPHVGLKGYLTSDANLDGEVDNVDKNEIWLNNINVNNQVPE